MATHTIRKASQEGVGYSTVDLSDVRHVFAAAIPRRGSTLREQADDALRIIEAVTHEEDARETIVHQAVFLADMGQIDECRRIIGDFYGSDLPATSYIPQSPCEGKLLAIECLGVGQNRGEVEIRRISEQLVIARHNRITWAHCAPVVPPTPVVNAYDGAMSGFEHIRSLLNGVDIRFDQVIRTWLYCGAIGDKQGASPRYQEINRARADFYRDVRFLNDRLPKDHCGRTYPASTGVGIDGRGIMLSAIALATDRDDIVAVPLENPRQTPAYEYSARYSPASPKFSRAMALSCGDYATIFISGTASIISSETQHPGAAAEQTHETLDNIAALISEKNLSGHGLPGLGTSLEGLGLVRIYVKRQEDYATVRAVCQERLGELPAIYALADVCRPELLVEIEGIAFSRHAAGDPM
jgi:enamine deaminase RidA (YjgF/YER057c/UK114 family)